MTVGAPRAGRRAGPARPWRGAAALAAVALLGGCAVWQVDPGNGASPPAAAAAGAADAAAAPAAGVEVDVVAPPPLRALLLRHLDLVRLGRVARGEVDDSEWSRLIDATPAQVRSLLQTEGHFAPQVRLVRLAASAAGQPDRVRVEVEPGPPAQVSRVTLLVEGELERAAAAGDARAAEVLRGWRQSWPLTAGRGFRNPAWNEAKANALARLRASGYAAATWNGTAADVDPDRAAVRLFLAADSGPLFRLGTLEIEGLATHQADTVRHLLAARAGAPVTETLLLDFQDRLVKSGLFEAAAVTLESEAAQAGEARVVARLRESPLQAYTAGVGYSANNGARVSGEGLFRRAFGAAATARLKGELGKQRQLLQGEVSTHPLDGLQRWLVGGAVERLVSSADAVLSQRLRLGRLQDLPALERLTFVEFERSLRTTGTGQRSDVSALSAQFHSTWRHLDSVLLPTKGVSLALQLGAGRSFRSTARDGAFGRAYARLTGYLPLGESWYGQARIELGRVFRGRGVAVPESQKWRAGGDESVRGYDYRSLGPRDADGVASGTALVTGSVEVARPLLDRLPSLWGALFVDAGNVADSFGALRPVLGYGFGVRWRSPVGPLRLDYAWGDAVGRGRIHFSVGIAF